MASSASGGGVYASAPTSAPALSVPVPAAASLYQHHHHQLPPPTGSQTSQSPAPNPQASHSPNSEGPQHQSQMSHGQQPTRNVSPSTFLSPRAGAASVTESTQYQTLIHLFKTTDPGIVRQAIRDTHEVTLLGSEYHFAFLLNTVFHQASPAILDDSVRKFGAKLVSSSFRSALGHVTMETLDRVSDILLPKLSNDFLDRALDKRLSTIRARSLVNALAKADRLGYDERDTVEERRDGTEHVIPHLKPDLAQTPAQRNGSSHPPQHLHTNQMRSSHPPQQLFTNQMSSHAQLPPHKMKKGCEHLETFDRINRDICPHCGATFTNSGGLAYHIKLQVCGHYTNEDVAMILPALAGFYHGRGARSMPSQQMASAHMNTPPSQKTGHATFRAVNAGSLPPPSSTSLTPLSQSKTADAYAHLSPRDRGFFDAAMKEAEEKYINEVKRAMANASFSPAEREVELAKLKNRFNTKQSLTRKKYGIRLRERRPKAELEAERNRMLSSLTFTPNLNASQATSGEPASKRQKTDMEGEPSGTTLSECSDPAVISPMSVAVEKMGGLANSAGITEHVDPTTSSATSQSHQPTVAQPPDTAAEIATATSQSNRPTVAQPPDTAAEMATATSQSHQPIVTQPPDTAEEMATATAQPNLAKVSNDSGVGGTPNDPMDVDAFDTDSDSDTEGGGDDDIPSILPQKA
ncbi:hypothetical protein EsDP_00004379 [Epichloe bromicola]|uniref:C2H2-type domain-containing protein n=1 Tax=Epichloe bromicola TaxID=79588 RepID=A0ABQ0CRJ0_9HYPO